MPDFCTETEEYDMGKRLERDTKTKIARAAWKLFSENGYEQTTVEDIIEASDTSRGSFYHYYEGKDALFGTMSFLFDDEYKKLAENMDEHSNSYEKLLYLNRGICEVIENRIMVDMLTRMYSTQLVTHGEKHLMDRNRVYYRLLRQIIEEGQQSGELSRRFTVNEIVKAYSMYERGMLYDWCICDAEYSLVAYTEKMMPLFLRIFLAENE